MSENQTITPAGHNPQMQPAAQPGEVLSLGVDQVHTHLFDAATGLRLAA